MGTNPEIFDWQLRAAAGPFYSLSPELAIATAYAFHMPLPEGAYYEFGIYRGYNLWFAEGYSRMIGQAKRRIIGFDSFEGLPPNTNGYHIEWTAGSYAAGMEEVLYYLTHYGADMSRITLAKGWFGAEHFAKVATMMMDLPPAALVVIDCDLYESCVPVLAFLTPLLRPGTAILFDDWKAYNNDPGRGERRAWTEFLMQHPETTGGHEFDFGQYGHAIVLDTYNWENT